MTLRDFFVGRAIGFLVLILIGLCVFAYKTYAPVREEVRTGAPAFAWRFAEGASLNPDGFPETDVFLAATYPDGSVQEKRIDTVPGGCSVLPDSEEGSVQGTVSAQCYYAGLGQRYRIVAGDSSYVVERKTFEEASPEHAPPQEVYQAVSAFSF